MRTALWLSNCYTQFVYSATQTINDCSCNNFERISNTKSFFWAIGQSFFECCWIMSCLECDLLLKFPSANRLINNEMEKEEEKEKQQKLKKGHN